MVDSVCFPFRDIQPAICVMTTPSSARQIQQLSLVRRTSVVLCLGMLLVNVPSSAKAQVGESTSKQQPGSGAGRIRIATFNVSMNRSESGKLLKDLLSESEQICQVASIIRLQRPDIILLNEFDYDEKNAGAVIFADEFLNADRSDLVGEPIKFPHLWSAAVNTGVDSSMDLNQNGNRGEAADAFGYGEFPGQYGMVLLSKYPIQESKIRTFQRLLWSRMPDAAVPFNPETKKPWYPSNVWEKLRLSSKSHWDIPVKIEGTTLHVLASHPTPPAFDGREDRNGRRNHDEIRFWVDYLTDGKDDWITDDSGGSGGGELSQPFVILGDLNADPADGDSHEQAINQVLQHPRVNARVVPLSDGAVEASRIQRKANTKHFGDSASDTADFSDGNVGNLRVDYVLPSCQIRVVKSGVFWPVQQDPLAVLLDCSDHRLVWMDIALPAQ